MIDPRTTLNAALARLAQAATPEEARDAWNTAYAASGSDDPEAAVLIDAVANRVQECFRLAALAGTDELTGVPNRRNFQEALEREVARHRRHGSGVSVVFLDLDGLKTINDTHGHAAGDLAITKMADACRSTLRNSDLVARIGGDEFAVLLPESSAANAQRAAHRLCQAVERESVAGVPLRVSVGLATAGSPEAKASELLALADLRLYANKRGRRRALELRQATAAA